MIKSLHRIVFLASILLSLSLYSNVFGDNDRVVVKSNDQPYSSIGRLSIGNSSCTAFLVSGDLIITASHCLYEENGDLTKTPITFRAGPSGEKPLASSNAYIIQSFKNFTNREFDWAILKLDYPIGETLGHISIARGFEINEQIRIAGFSYLNQVPYHMYEQKNCSIKEIIGTQFYHNCDSSRGDSGSPILNDKNQLIGIMVSEKRYDQYSMVLDNYDHRFANLGISAKIFESFINKLTNN